MSTANDVRMAFLHSPNRDTAGYEWGVAKVRFGSDGQPASFLWGASDHSDLDAAMPHHLRPDMLAANERETFEATIGAGRVLVKTEAGEYVSPYVQNDWEVWQARAAQPQAAPTGAGDAEPVGWYDANQANPTLELGARPPVFGGNWKPVYGHEAKSAPQRPAATAAAESFQARVQPWLLACFGELIAGDREERNHRFLEEALELVQACGCTASEAHQLVDYVFGRAIGEPEQEVGGVMVTLAALCLAHRLDMHAAAEVELARIWTKVEQIRAKQAAKPKHSPLPGPTTAAEILDTPLETGEGDAR